MDLEIDKRNAFYKKFGFYLDHLILLDINKNNNIHYYSNHNKIDLYRYDVNNNEWTFIWDGVKKLNLNIQ